MQSLKIIKRGLKEKSVNEIPIVIGGVIPDKDETELKKLGVKEIFRSGSSLSDIVGIVTKFARKKQAAESA